MLTASENLVGWRPALFRIFSHSLGEGFARGGRSLHASSTKAAAACVGGVPIFAPCGWRSLWFAQKAVTC